MRLVWGTAAVAAVWGALTASIVGASDVPQHFYVRFSPHVAAVGPAGAAVAAVWGALDASIARTYDYPRHIYVRFRPIWRCVAYWGCSGGVAAVLIRGALGA